MNYDELCAAHHSPFSGAKAKKPSAAAAASSIHSSSGFRQRIVASAQTPLFQAIGSHGFCPRGLCSNRWHSTKSTWLLFPCLLWSAAPPYLCSKKSRSTSDAAAGGIHDIPSGASGLLASHIAKAGNSSWLAQIDSNSHKHSMDWGLILGDFKPMKKGGVYTVDHRCIHWRTVSTGYKTGAEEHRVQEAQALMDTYLPIFLGNASKDLRISTVSFFHAQTEAVSAESCEVRKKESASPMCQSCYKQGERKCERTVHRRYITTTK